ncbi:MAG: hypothetical protein WAT12_14240 [Candidatus Nitrotoga sp.]
MSKLDTSSGLTSLQVGTIKFAIKRAVSLKLPELPGHIETNLFLQGRDAWTYSWHLLDQDAQNSLHPISIEVEVKLKKEFCQYQPCSRYTFLCKLQLQPDIHSSIKSIRNKAPNPALQGTLRDKAAHRP